MNISYNNLRKFDYIYFILVAILIIIIISMSLYQHIEMNKIKNFEEKTILYLDKELCERLKFLESQSNEFKKSGNVSQPCNAYDKLELKRLINE